MWLFYRFSLSGYSEMLKYLKCFRSFILIDLGRFERNEKYEIGDEMFLYVANDCLFDFVNGLCLMNNF